jgi:hypothetical protein
MAKYKVLAPLVQLKLRDAMGSLVFRHFYAGAVLDTDQVELDEANLRSHLDSGLLVDEDAVVAEVFAVPAGTPLPGKPPNVAVAETGDAAATGQPVPPLSVGLLRAADLDASGDEEWAAGSTDGGQRDADGKPDGRSSQSAWRDYHAKQLMASGVPEGDAYEESAQMSKADLVARYK